MLLASRVGWHLEGGLGSWVQPHLGSLSTPHLAVPGQLPPKGRPQCRAPGIHFPSTLSS